MSAVGNVITALPVHHLYHLLCRRRLLARGLRLGRVVGHRRRLGSEEVPTLGLPLRNHLGHRRLLHRQVRELGRQPRNQFGHGLLDHQVLTFLAARS